MRFCRLGTLYGRITTPKAVSPKLVFPIQNRIKIQFSFSFSFFILFYFIFIFRFISIVERACFSSFFEQRVFFFFCQLLRTHKTTKWKQLGNVPNSSLVLKLLPKCQNHHIFTICENPEKYTHKYLIALVLVILSWRSFRWRYLCLFCRSVPSRSVRTRKKNNGPTDRITLHRYTVQ